MTDAAEIDNKRLLELTLGAGVRHGIEKAGICRLGDLSRLIECRGRSSLPESGSVLLLLMPFYTGEYPTRNVACYAVPDDYHRIGEAILLDIISVLRREYPAAVFLPFVDSSPIPEVEAAQRAGLGFRGRNGQLITGEYGSMTFICEIVTNLKLIPTEAADDSCGACRRCIDSCPTGALTISGLNPNICRSHITQKKGELTRWEQAQVAIGGLAWGCDICTLVCPKNRGLAETTVMALRKNLLPQITEAGLDAQMTDKSYLWRGKAVLRRNLAIIGNQSKGEGK